jgi:type 1 fimbria pilin
MIYVPTTKKYLAVAWASGANTITSDAKVEPSSCALKTAKADITFPTGFNGVTAFTNTITYDESASTPVPLTLTATTWLDDATN